MSLSRNIIWQFFGIKPNSKIATETFVNHQFNPIGHPDNTVKKLSQYSK